MWFCGLRKPRPLRPRKLDKGKSVEQDYEADSPGRLDVREGRSRDDNSGLAEGFELRQQKTRANFDWAREDQLSTILEQISERSRTNTPNWENEPSAKAADAKWDPAPSPTFVPKFASAAFKKTRFVEHVDNIPEDRLPLMSFPAGKSPDTPRSITPPPRDVSAVLVALTDA